ncbi:amino acid ABC transporter substrate-binding protein [Gottfriedia solisilvae]|uniref:Amino acid ABC transporter substrate-binding protein n=1 Tax=Gottfriedia solisilvae TaxID=1516104 RepID=A0A8J3AWL8_9BACI|nr:amino acid ABC transporter substrate-binding protein [Gottfriedia solisilvae]GGI17583.1 amino acid ABC transporter substrate-binding protein [Gottfriedia solisilvae]
MKNKYITAIILLMISILIVSGCGKEKRNANEVVLGLDDTFVPMGFKDDQGKFVGFDIDLAKEVFKRENMKVTFQPIDWSMKETELISGNIDTIWNGYSITDERKKKVNFSKAYLSNRQVIITLANSSIQSKSDLKNQIVGIQEGSSSLEAVNKEKDLVDSFKDGKPVLYENNNQALMDLEAKRVDAVVADETLARYYMNKRGESKYKILEDNFGEEDYGIGVRKDDKELLNKINKQIDAMKKDGTYDKIYQKWFGTLK